MSVSRLRTGHRYIYGMDADQPTDTNPPAAAEPVCYRHSDRITYLRCSECDKPICPDCSYDSAVGQKCAECAKPTGRGQVISSRQLQSQRTPVVTGIIALTVVAYLIQRGNVQFTNDFALTTWKVRDGEWWRAITSAFLHANTLLHIGFNMYLLYALGPRIERQVGGLAFGGLYLASALAGSAAFQYLAEGSAVGASGAVFGLFGAVLIGTYPIRHTTHGGAQFRQLLVLIGINLALPLVIPNIAWQAHVGGLIAGIAIVAVWQRLQPGPQARAQRVIVAYGVALVGLVAILVA